MQRTELIRLDVRVFDVIAEAVFRAELANGHRIVAYAKRGQQDAVRGVKPGDTVEVEMSPYDMSRGSIVGQEQAEV